MRRVVEAPVAVEEPPLGLHPPEERRAGIRRQDVERRALEPVRLDPRDGPVEDVGAVVVEAEDEAAVHLDAVVVEDPDAPRVVGGGRRLLPGVGEVRVGERLEADEDARAAGERHLPHEARVVGHVDGDGRAPDPLERRERPAEAAQVLRVRAEVVVDEDGVGLARREPLGHDLRRLLHAPRHADAARREVAEVAAVVAAARRHQARRRQERLPREEVAARRRGVAIRGAEVGPVDGLESPVLGVGEDPRPERDAVADRDRVGVRRRLVGAGRDVEAAEDDEGAALAVPAGELVRPLRERQVDGDPDDPRERLVRRRPLEEVLVPEAHVPAFGRRGRDARERERRREDVLAEARVRVLRVEGVQEEGEARRRRPRAESRVEPRRLAQLTRRLLHGPLLRRTGPCPFSRARSRAGRRTGAPARRTRRGPRRARRLATSGQKRSVKKTSAYAASQRRKSLIRCSPPVLTRRSTSGAPPWPARASAARSASRVGVAAGGR